MEKETMNEGGKRYFQGSARDFTPIMVSADFAALKGPARLPDLPKVIVAMEEFAVSVGKAA